MNMLTKKLMAEVFSPVSAIPQTQQGQALPQPNVFGLRCGSNPIATGILALAILVPTAARCDDYAVVGRLVRTGQLGEAEKIADKFLVGKPRDAQMRFFKGVIQTEHGKHSEAIQSFYKLTEDFPALPEPYNNLAVLYAQKSQFDKARAALEIATRINTNYATAYENLGDVHAKLASIAYSKAVQLDANNVAIRPKLTLMRDLFSLEVKNTTGKSADREPSAPKPRLTSSSAARETISP